MKKALSCKNLWEKFPPRAKAGVGVILGAIPPRYLLGRKFRRNRKLLLDAQRWPIEHIRAYQLEHLRRICMLAVQKTPFYRKVFQSVGFDPRDLKSPDDIRGLPIIDKHVIRENLADMCTFSSHSMGVDFVSTGGTMGNPLNFYMDSGRSSVEYAYLMESWRRIGFELGDPMAVIRGRVVSEDRSGFRHEFDPIFKHHYYSNFHMTDANMTRYLDHIRTLGRCFLHVYPSSVFALVRFIRRSGIKAPGNIRGIIAESEIVYPDQRKAAEETFGCRFFSCYGHTEKLILAAECEYSTDYHVWPTYGYFELVDEENNPVTTPGRSGEIVGTGFINSAVPFIRYRTGDFAVWVGDRCMACGREHPLIRDIQGHRTQEFLVTSDGSMISWTAMNMHDDTFTRVHQFQFFQDTAGKAILKVVPASGFNDDDTRRVLGNLNRKLNGQVRLTLQRVESIPLSPRGKAIYVDQRVNLDIPAGERQSTSEIRS